MGSVCQYIRSLLSSGRFASKTPSHVSGSACRPIPDRGEADSRAIGMVATMLATSVHAGGSIQ